MFLPRILVLTCVVLSAQTPDLALPSWLVPFPGAAERRTATKASAESAYTVKADTDQVLAHYRSLFSTAGLPFSPNSDGIGLSARAAVPECDLLVKIRTQEPEVVVKISCTSRSANASGDFQGALPTVTRGSGGRSSSFPAHKSPEEIRRYFDEQHQRVMAEAEADRQRRRDSMSAYDKPVRVVDSKKSFYNDDAPPLVWPNWLVRVGSNARVTPRQTVEYGKKCLIFSYETNMPMSKLHTFYEDLLTANGFQVPVAKLSTGHTIGGAIIQNASGRVEGHQGTDGKVSGPQTRIEVTYSRSVLNGPITVRMQVRTTGSFGRH